MGGDDGAQTEGAGRAGAAGGRELPHRAPRGRQELDRGGSYGTCPLPIFL